MKRLFAALVFGMMLLVPMAGCVAKNTDNPKAAEDKTVRVSDGMTPVGTFGFNRDDSEHIVDYTYEYQYCLNISYNADGTAGAGSAIFLHCLGNRKPRTGGCVAIPMDQMYFVMQHVDPSCTVIIDSLENMGGEL